MRVRELAKWLAATFEGDGERELAKAAPLETAGALDLSFVSSRKAAEQAQSSAAGCLIVPPEFLNSGGRTVIRVREPRAAFARAVSRLHPQAPVQPGIHSTAVIASTTEIGAAASIGPHVSIGEGTVIGARCRIGAGCAIGRRVVLGDDSILYANVTIYDEVDIGVRAILHSGCVIGADGFGFILTGDRYGKFPQIGRVVIDSDVEIGANSCVDRAALGVTWIGEGTKLDNLVHVAHNCRIGRHVVVAAQTGFSGGVIVEDYAVIGGQVGVGDKARIESRAVIGSGSGILTSKIVRGGQVVWGTPARPLKEYLELLANLGRLPEVRRELAALKQRLEELEAGESGPQRSREPRT
jgi:UDP-3-O-[3-hydroxymyristoyl] glucosamine N-acyltransferase